MNAIGFIDAHRISAVVLRTYLEYNPLIGSLFAPGDKK